MFKNDLRFLINSPFIESLNGSLRNECLNTNRFPSIEDAQEKLEMFRRDYNEFRPHSSLDNMTPSEFDGQLSIGQISQITDIIDGVLRFKKINRKILIRKIYLSIGFLTLSSAIIILLVIFEFTYVYINIVLIIIILISVIFSTLLGRLGGSLSEAILPGK